MTVAGSFRGQSGTARLRVATTRLAGLDVVWLQPVEGRNALAEFLARHGEGVFSLNYQAPGLDALEAEVSRLFGARRRGVLQGPQVPLQRRRAEQMVRLNGHREPAGQVRSSVWLHGAPAASRPRPRVTRPPKGRRSRVRPVAIRARRRRACSRSAELLGPPRAARRWPSRTRPARRPALPRPARPASTRRLGLAPPRDRHLGVDRAPAAGRPSTEEHLDRPTARASTTSRFDVPDIDAAASRVGARSACRGRPVRRAWGAKGEPGSGRFAYADTAPIGGVTVKLLWNQQ